jgi:hypothetical protein
MRAFLSASGWLLVSDLLGLSLFAALMLGGTGSPVFATLLLLAPLVLLCAMHYGAAE